MEKTEYSIPESTMNVCKFLEYSITNYESKGLPNETETKCFYSNRVPQISIRDYAKRMHKYTKCSVSSFVSALFNIVRLMEKNSEIMLTKLSIHRYLHILY